MMLIPAAGGVKVDLDFSHIADESWFAMLQAPDDFGQFGYGVYGSPGKAALPFLTELLPIQGLGTPQIQILEHQSRVLTDPQLKVVSCRPPGSG